MTKTSKSLRLTIAAVAAVAVSMVSNAQSSQSVNAYRSAHSRMLAKQERVQDKIKNEDSQRYARDLYGNGAQGAEGDIYSLGWNSGSVNAYKGMTVPATKTINLRGYAMPVKSNRVNSHYGFRKTFGRQHKGVDIQASVGDTVKAAFDGKVRLTKFDRNGYGFYVIVRHDNGLETVYGHLSRFLVKPDQYVKAGTPIALSGNTGRSTGPHLHFETRFMGIAINPESIFNFEQRRTHHDVFTFNKNNTEGSARQSASTSRRRR